MLLNSGGGTLQVRLGLVCGTVRGGRPAEVVADRASVGHHERDNGERCDLHDGRYVGDHK